MKKLKIAHMDNQLADCITVYCMAALKGLGKVNFQEVTGSFWRFNYKKDPLIFFSLSLFNSPFERNRLLNDYFNIQLTAIEEPIVDYHQIIISSLSKTRLPMVFIDRFDLPHDNICFQKFHENHYLLIRGYDPINQEYHIVDFFTTPSFTKVNRNIIEESIKKAFYIEHPMIIASIEKIEHTFNQNTLTELIQSNYKHMTQKNSNSSGLLGVESLYTDLEKRDDYLQDYIKVINLFSKLKHMGSYRAQHADFINTYFGHPVLENAFHELDHKWKLVANYILKAHLTKNDTLISRSLNTLQEIIQIKKEILPLYEQLTKGE